VMTCSSAIHQSCFLKLAEECAMASTMMVLWLADCAASQEHHCRYQLRRTENLMSVTQCWFCAGSTCTQTLQLDVGHPAIVVYALFAGFYYVALDRSTGAVRGLYFDPSSSPFQELNLQLEDGMRSGAGACDMRTDRGNSSTQSAAGSGSSSSSYGQGVSFTSYSFA